MSVQSIDNFIDNCKCGCIEGVIRYSDDDLCVQAAGLRWAAYNGHINVVEFLVKKVFYLESILTRAAEWAVSTNQWEVVKYLFLHGADKKFLGELIINKLEEGEK